LNLYAFYDSSVPAGFMIEAQKRDLSAAADAVLADAE